MLALHSHCNKLHEKLHNNVHDFSKCLANDPSCVELILAHRTVTSGLPVMNTHMDSQTDTQTDRQTYKYQANDNNLLYIHHYCNYCNFGAETKTDTTDLHDIHSTSTCTTFRQCSLQEKSRKKRFSAIVKGASKGGSLDVRP